MSVERNSKPGHYTSSRGGQMSKLENLTKETNKKICKSYWKDWESTPLAQHFEIWDYKSSIDGSDFSCSNLKMKSTYLMIKALERWIAICVVDFSLLYHKISELHCVLGKSCLEVYDGK